mmetsp:Transcript_11765/g.37322  ORF Transcript_11765/g.37322 Transcript_11765/m.37322 type:complete len:282 (-) Transcript_11765:1822-2667(-)
MSTRTRRVAARRRPAPTPWTRARTPRPRRSSPGPSGRRPRQKLNGPPARQRGRSRRPRRVTHAHGSTPSRQRTSFRSPRWSSPSSCRTMPSLKLSTFCWRWSGWRRSCRLSTTPTLSASACTSFRLRRTSPNLTTLPSSALPWTFTGRRRSTLMRFASPSGWTTGRWSRRFLCRTRLRRTPRCSVRLRTCWAASTCFCWMSRRKTRLTRRWWRPLTRRTFLSASSRWPRTWTCWTPRRPTRFTRRSWTTSAPPLLASTVPGRTWPRRLSTPLSTLALVTTR